MRAANLLWVGVLVSALGGCASWQGSQLESVEAVQQQLFADMPMPAGARLDNRQSLILGGGPGWTGRVALQLQQGPTEAFNFYREQYPAAGWTAVSSIKARVSILVFSRQERTVTLEISEAGSLSGGSAVLMTVAPRGAGTPPAVVGKPAVTR